MQQKVHSHVGDNIISVMEICKYQGFISLYFSAIIFWKTICLFMRYASKKFLSLWPMRILVRIF